MKKILTIAAILFIGVANLVNAQPFSVTFEVDMTVKAAEGTFDSGTSNLFVRGNFNDWGQEPMADANTDLIYDVTISGFGADSAIAYKFFYDNPDQWEDAISNREHIVSGDVTLTDFFDRDSVISLDQYSLTFQVDMSVQVDSGFVAADSKVYVRGSFNGWGTDDVMDDSDGDLTYEVVVDSIYSGTTVFFKYFYDNPDTWEADPNREFTVNQDDTFFDFFDREAPAASDTFDVTFQVDMDVKAQEGTFVPADSKVYVRGSFNGWGSTEMAAGANNVYETVVAIPEFETIYYKFFYDNPDTWEGDPNREHLVTADVTLLDYFDRDDVVDITSDGNILFNVDMSVMEEIGIFNPVVDSLQVRGGFNGWGDSDPARSKLNQNPLIPTLYSLNVPFETSPVGDDLEYKFYVKLETPGLWVDGWERPSTQGGGNRNVTFEGKPDQLGGSFYYDDIQPDWVIPSGTSVEITFSVDMTVAMNPDSQAVPFNPATDSVFWVGEQPSFVRTQGWEDSNEMKYLELTDGDGDNIYTGTLTVNGPAFNSFGYRYGYTSASDGSFIAEPEGFSDFAYRFRYIAMNGARDFVQPYDAPTDSWWNHENKVLQSEDGPALTSVKEIDLTVNKFELNQNYPNPFNPATLIRFSVPENGMVSLSVFNVLGQQVKTLVNKDMKAGSYEVDFNGAELSSGVYLYKLSTGNFTATRKMLLVK